MKKVFVKTVIALLAVLIIFSFSACEKKVFSLVYYAGEGGSVSGKTVQTIKEGNDAEAVTAVAEVGYIFVKWSDGDTNETRQEKNVTGNLAVRAKFEKTINDAVYIASEGGYIAGKTLQKVKYGENAETVTAIPDIGYEFVKWSDGVNTAERRDENVTDEISVTAEFKKTTYSARYNASDGGSVGGNASQTVAHGDNAETVTAIPDIGYEFVKWSDGLTDAERRDENVTGEINVTAEFAKTTYSARYSVAEGGTLCGIANQSVEYGEYTQLVTVVPLPNAGYIFDGWSDGFAERSRFDFITGDLAVTANFRRIYASGRGTPSEPYLINNYQELIDMVYFPANHYILTNDLDLSGINHKPIFDDKLKFDGGFDGGNHVIKNMTVDVLHNYPSLFGCILSGSVKNLNIQNFDIKIPNEQGIFAGAVCGDTLGKLTNITASGTITATALDKNYTVIGGLVGKTSNTIESCYTDIAIRLDNIAVTFAVGGLAGWSSGAEGYTRIDIISCGAKGSIHINYKEDKGGGDVGGLVGIMLYEEPSGLIAESGSGADGSGVIIRDSYSAVDIYCNDESQCGGLAAYAVYGVSVDIISCYATGDITIEGTQGSAGGFINTFYSYGGLIQNCYATGNVKAGVAAGFGVRIDGFGSLNSDSVYFKLNIDNCYATGKVVGFGEGAGFCSVVISVNFYRCYSAGSVQSERNGAGFIYMLTSYGNEGITEECFSTGDVRITGGGDIAGFIAYADGIIKNCYSKSNIYILNIATAYVGGFVYSVYGYLINCYYTGKISEEGSAVYNAIGGFVGYNFGGIINCHLPNFDDGIAADAVYGDYGASTDVTVYEDISDMYCLADLLNGEESVWTDISNDTPQLSFMILKKVL
ncbi:MAG: InlB B-repeat-containing protein [Clostridiales bacterium]|nr:InlB B-repeat-containing protein [Clostridiales bacterium]